MAFYHEIERQALSLNMKERRRLARSLRDSCGHFRPDNPAARMETLKKAASEVWGRPFPTRSNVAPQDKWMRAFVVNRLLNERYTYRLIASLLPCCQPSVSNYRKAMEYLLDHPHSNARTMEKYIQFNNKIASYD